METNSDVLDLLRELHEAQVKHYALFPDLTTPIPPGGKPQQLTPEQIASLEEHGAFIAEWRERWRVAQGK